MPLYFFYLRDGADTLIDEEGMDLAGFEEAKVEALRQARDIISHEARRGRIDLCQRVDVVDAEGATIYSLKFVDAVDVQT